MRFALIALGAMMFLTHSISAQKWSTRSGMVAFEASMPGFEPIQGTTAHASALADFGQRQIAVLVRVRDIEFPNDLMQKHFNENYMDSDVFPRITFSGGWEVDTPGKDAWNVKGLMKIRDVSREISLPMEARQVSGQWILKGSFELRPEDYGVEVPRLVRMKIAEVARIQFELPLEPMN